jgi:hypothetical protein
VKIRPLDLAVGIGSALSVLGAAAVAYNASRVPAPPADPPEVTETVSVCLPCRNEAHRVGPTIRSLLAQRGITDLEILVLDDDSTDGTAELIRSIADGDPRLKILTGKPLTEGWKGKPHACAQLAEVARGTVLIFVDADVEFAPHAMAACVALLRSAKQDMISPFPGQVMGSWSERLYQPLVGWTWLSNIPVHKGTPSDPPPTPVANGQFLVFDAEGYRHAGGHTAVFDKVAEDLEILRAVLRSGGRATAVDGSKVAFCRMYADWPELRDGYTKWLWAWVDTPQKVAMSMVSLGVVYLLPPLAALRGSKVGLVGYLAGVAGRAAAARRFSEPVWPHSATHPAACAMSGYLILESWRRHRKGQLSWKGRTVG